jgi:hypothetical protein
MVGATLKQLLVKVHRCYYARFSGEREMWSVWRGYHHPGWSSVYQTIASGRWSCDAFGYQFEDMAHFPARVLPRSN